MVEKRLLSRTSAGITAENRGGGGFRQNSEQFIMIRPRQVSLRQTILHFS